jgi:hypothetical protein
MKLSDLKDALDSAHKAGLSALVKGAPGIGKTTAVRDYAKRAKLNLINIHAPLSDLLDIKGALSVQEGVAQFLPLVKWPREKDKPALILIDEFPQCVQAIQNGYSQLLIERIMGEIVLPKGSFVVATGNRKKDKAATHNYPAQITSRVVHLEIDLDHAGFLDWGVPNGIHPQIIAFGRFRQDALFTFDPKQSQEPYACYRTWEYASNLLKTKPKEHLLPELIAGVVGEGPAYEFMAFRRTYENLPTAKETLNSPNAMIIPEDVATLYAITTSVAYTVDDSTVDNFFKFAERLDKEFQVLMVKTAKGNYPRIIKAKAFSAWARANSQLLTETREEKAA